jgi:hypothetical protein
MEFEESLDYDFRAKALKELLAALEHFNAAINLRPNFYTTRRSIDLQPGQLSLNPRYVSNFNFCAIVDLSISCRVVIIACDPRRPAWPGFSISTDAPAAGRYGPTNGPAYLLPIAHTRLRVHRAPGIPHALCFRGGDLLQTSGA